MSKPNLSLGPIVCLKTLSSFEVEQSFRNIVGYYSKELTLIYDGHKASKCFSEPQRKKLTKIGVLERVYQRQGCRLRLSDKALDVLGSFDVPSFRVL